MNIQTHLFKKYLYSFKNYNITLNLFCKCFKTTIRVETYQNIGRKLGFGMDVAVTLNNVTIFTS